MAPKEDMLPPGWDDLDRYVDHLLPALLNALALYHPIPLHLHDPVEPKRASTGDLNYFLFRLSQHLKQL
jgi:hypothetical protein